MKGKREVRGQRGTAGRGAGQERESRGVSLRWLRCLDCIFCAGCRTSATSVGRERAKNKRAAAATELRHESVLAQATCWERSRGTAESAAPREACTTASDSLEPSFCSRTLKELRSVHRCPSFIFAISQFRHWGRLSIRRKQAQRHAHTQAVGIWWDSVNGEHLAAIFLLSSAAKRIRRVCSTTAKDVHAACSTSARDCAQRLCMVFVKKEELAER